jgi:cohesin loading factor subunit SCC2
VLRGFDFLEIVARLQQTIKRSMSADPNPNEVRALVILIFIVSLLAENFDFDALRKEKSGKPVELCIPANC